MNDKWLASILIFFFICHIFATNVFTEDLWLFNQMMLVISLTVTTSLIVMLILHYRDKSKDFTKSYIFLAISLGGYTVAELLWTYFEGAGIETYPSIAEPFYVVHFTFAILFCFQFIWNKKNWIISTRYYKKANGKEGKIFVPSRIMLTGIAAALLTFTSYLVLTGTDYDTEIIWYSSLMMVLSATLAGSAVTASLIIFKSPRLRIVWVMYGIAFVGNSIADTFYYAGENNGQFAYTDWTNIIWFGFVLLVFYAGFIHNYLYRKP